MRVFGMLGILFGPLALSYFFELLEIYEEMQRRAADPVPAHRDARTGVPGLAPESP
jgi:predicted PurR-regulated permease PerM